MMQVIKAKTALHYSFQVIKKLFKIISIIVKYNALVIPKKEKKSNVTKMEITELLV